MSAITPYDWAIIAFVIGVTFLCVFMLTVPLLLGGKSWGRAKQEQFESGVVGAGGARIRLSAKFYLVAIFFVVFDLEALYLYAWATSVREVGCFCFHTTRRLSWNLTCRIDNQLFDRIKASNIRKIHIWRTNFQWYTC